MKAARRLFAERGFYGTSIAAIADELALTKQALIHHFGTKERLYGEVLAQLAGRLTHATTKARAAHADPARQLEELFVTLHGNTLRHVEDTQLIMRELLDNKGRAEHAQSWYLKDFLNALAQMMRGASAKRLTETDALARIYLTIGAINFLAISQPTLRQMYGRDFAALKEQFPHEIRRIVRTSLAK